MPSNELKKRNTSSSTSPKKKPKESSKTKDKEDNKKDNVKAVQNPDDEPPPPPPKFGPLVPVSKQRLWSRSALIIGLMTVVYFTSGKNEEVFADSKPIKAKSMDTKCSPEFLDSKCQTTKCGRLVSDALMTPEEIFALIDLCRRGFISHKGVSVMDLGQRALKVDGMVKSLDGIFNKDDGAVFQAVKSKLQRLVSAHFAIDYWKLLLAGPVFLSMMKPGGKEVSLIQSHENTLSYTYSTIVFLTDNEKDFEGGRIVFVDSDNTNRTVVPIQGRVLAFSSGTENRFYYEKVEKGLSYALTLGFTCDSKKSILDPRF